MAHPAPDAGQPRNGAALCLIVKNEEATLPACLESAAGLAAEIVVVDTGSTDGTRASAARFGARVIDFPWCDDFAAARNEGLRHATAPWIFWMDADDRLDEANRCRLRTLFAGLKPEMTGFLMSCVSWLDPMGAGRKLADHVRLFPNHPSLRWCYRVHEQILPALLRQGGKLTWTDVEILHTGYQDAKILRVLQEQAFERVGGNETIRTDVRLIAATHRDLKAWSEEGKFRPDLYYRLGVFTIHLPPLRERDDDLLIAGAVLPAPLQPRTRAGGPRGQPRGAGAAARLPVAGQRSRAAERPEASPAQGPVLLPAFLPDLQESRRSQGSQNSDSLTPDSCSPTPGLETFVIRQRVASDVRDLYAETHRQVNRLLLARVLEHTRGNLQQAALLLGIARQTLRLKLRDLGLSVTRSEEPEEGEAV